MKTKPTMSEFSAEESARIRAFLQSDTNTQRLAREHGIHFTTLLRAGCGLRMQMAKARAVRRAVGLDMSRDDSKE